MAHAGPSLEKPVQLSKLNSTALNRHLALNFRKKGSANFGISAGLAGLITMIAVRPRPAR
jgi:hypothetical protein